MYIQTERLILRNFMNSDLEIFLAYRNDPVVAKFQGWGLPYPREKAEAFVASMTDRVALKQDGWIQYAVAVKDTNELVGDLGCYVKKTIFDRPKSGLRWQPNIGAKDT
ncbi:MAG: GNAT family N-acetyltransferase [Anaerolineales bacterium]|nr:GNAT family N-acetyltransferase [Anaerolineales bacterium]